MLPPTRALWLPAGVRHRTGVTQGCLVRGIYIEPGRCPVGWPEPTMPAMSPLLRELLEHLADDMLPSAARLRAEAVVFDLLDPVQVIPIGVRMPSDGRARAIATALVANPADQRTLPELAAQAGASARTIARLFHRETAMTFGRWRTQVRLRAGLPLLAQGVALSGIAARVGYSTPSAFVAAFHREGGVSPRRYFSG